MLFLRFYGMLSYLPHTLIIGREKSCNQRALKPLNASYPKKALSNVKINHKIPIPTI
ncbi:hypothetical protein KVC57_00135 [Helicobacter pylori]|nr:hypothetical protein KVC57_00135 [Helicobacter pylori]